MCARAHTQRKEVWDDTWLSWPIEITTTWAWRFLKEKSCLEYSCLASLCFISWRATCICLVLLWWHPVTDWWGRQWQYKHKISWDVHDLLLDVTLPSFENDTFSNNCSNETDGKGKYRIFKKIEPICWVSLNTWYWLTGRQSQTLGSLVNWYK